MKHITVSPKADAQVAFRNSVDFCVGTGRMGLALGEEYRRQLRMVQELVGFRFIRGHGLFCDDMAIYQQYEQDGEICVEYNFTYLDMVMDSYLAVGLRPFLELGFMPENLASGTQTIFYWKGNTTPPASYDRWCALVQATLRHLMDRYGADEVTGWPVEVWNEPNLPGFWEHADMKEYFKLFTLTFAAVKEVDPRFRVGGPAVCGGSDELWIRSFLEYCHENGIRPDFITRHHYTTELPDDVGRYGYAALMDQEEGFANLRTSRDIADSFDEFRGADIHVTETNTSYIPNCPVHDTNQNAAYIARQLSRLGDVCASYSYWTFGDIFEERGVPRTLFHGGFGMVANGCIAKPTLWSFVFFKKLKAEGAVCIHRCDNSIVLKYPDGTLRAVLWNDTRFRGEGDMTVTLELPLSAGEYSAVTQRVDEDCCNPLRVWHDLGEPSSPNAEQLELLRRAGQPLVTSARLCADGGRPVALDVELKENALVYIEVRPSVVTPDRGYDYDRVMGHPATNPLTRLDYPDPDVLRVGDEYYMVSTTMHFYPGCEILRSRDLVHWEHAAYVYDRVDSTPARRLEGGNIYGKGMWAACLRYHKGEFFVCFCANDTHKTYLFRSDRIDGEWKCTQLEGFFHDSSLLFDDDGRVFIAHGNKSIRITELRPDLSGALEGGFDRVVVEDAGNDILGYEGSHLYKIDGRYCLFMIHSRPDRWRRVEAFFSADRIDGEWTGGDCFDGDLGWRGQGIAQGGIVDTPDGRRFAVLFQDRGAVGRIPMLLPFAWQDGRPVFGDAYDGVIDTGLEPVSPTECAPLVGNDDFRGGYFGGEAANADEKRAFGCFGLRSFWQFNHEPELSLIENDRENGKLIFTTGAVCKNVVQARNTLTQRMSFPGCKATVMVDAAGLKDGDFAGLCALQGAWGCVGVERRGDEFFAVVRARRIAEGDRARLQAEDSFGDAGEILAERKLPDSRAVLRIEADFSDPSADARDVVRFFCLEGWRFKQLGGAHEVFFRLDHFCGCRFGLFAYATKEAGGKAAFERFEYSAR